MIPVVQTQRLTLRGYRLEDFDAYADFWASDRAKPFGGPYPRRDAWDSFLADAGHWSIRGFGQWIVEDRASDEAAGWVGFNWADGYNEPELGWTLYAAFEGRGLATEAAIAARAHGAAHFGIMRPASLIDPKNARSIATARRLGATLEDTRDFGNGPCHVYRHPQVLQ